MQSVFFGRHFRRTGFTLIEVLVVVAIIALLVAILLPSLAKAREETRKVVCLANMSNLPKAVLTFAAQHKGFGQLVPYQSSNVNAYTVSRHDSGGSIYAYEEFDRSKPKFKAWPIAYGDALGLMGVRKNRQYFEDWNNGSASKNAEYYFRTFRGRRDSLLCPADKAMVNYLTGGDGAGTKLAAPLSYGVNEDVFGAMGGGGCYRGPWSQNNGTAADQLRAGPRIEGRIDAIVRPSEVAFFADAGRDSEGEDWRQMELITIKPATGFINGPYLENVDVTFDRLARFRHSAQGGVGVALADGSGRFAKSVGKCVLRNQKNYSSRFAPRVRVSPYGNFEPAPAQP